MSTSQYYVVITAIEHWSLFIPKTMQNKILNIFRSPQLFFFTQHCVTVGFEIQQLKLYYAQVGHRG